MRFDGHLFNPAIYLPYMRVIADPRERSGVVVALGAGAIGFGLITLLLRS